MTNAPMGLTGADAAKDKKGVCGITADGKAMRMMLLRNVMGASTYHYHAEQTVMTLRTTAEGQSPFDIREPAIRDANLPRIVNQKQSREVRHGESGHAGGY